MNNEAIQNVKAITDFDDAEQVTLLQLKKAGLFDDVFAVLGEYLYAHDITLFVEHAGYSIVYDGKEEKQTSHVTVTSALEHALNLYKQRIVAAGDDKPQPLIFPKD